MQEIVNQQQSNIGEFILNDLREAENERVQDKELSDEKWGKYLLIFQGVIYLVAIISYGYGDPKYLGIPYDSENYACGVDLGLEQYSIIYFTNPTNAKYNWKTLCVSKCPKATSPEAESDESLEIDCYPNSVITSCQNRPSLDDPDYSLHYYDTVQFNTACLPTKTSYLQTILPALNQPAIVNMLSDIDHGKWIIVSMLCLCMILNLTFYNCLYKIPSQTIWILSVCSSVFLLLSGSLGLLYSMNVNNMQEIPNKDSLTEEECIGVVQAQTVQTGLVIILSIIFLTLGVVIIVWSIFDRKKISTIGKKISIINYYIDKTPTNLGNERFSEILYLILCISISLVIFAIIWMKLSLYLFSMGSVIESEHQLPYQQYVISWVAYILGIIHIIELIVIGITIIQSGIFIIMAKIVEIYRFTIQQHGYFISKQNNDRGIIEIIQMYLKFNIGTVIIGEILIILSGIPRYCLEFYYWFRIKINKPSEINERNQKILSINDRAYLFTFLKNDNFLDSCKNQQQVDIDLKNINKLYDHGYTFKIMYCSAISNFCISVTYLIIMLSTKNISLNNPVALLMIVLLFTYMISSVFASVHGQSIEYLNIILHRDMKQQQNPGQFMNHIVQALSKKQI